MELKADQRGELLTRLGYDVAVDDDDPRAKEAIQWIEWVLGTYSAAVDTLDRSPRAADYRDTLQPIAEKAGKLSEELRHLGDQYRKAIEVRGNFGGQHRKAIEGRKAIRVQVRDVNLQEIADKLGMLATRCEVVIEKTLAAQPESRGRRVKEALSYMIAELRKAFAKFYCGPDDMRTRHGAATPLSEREADEVEFIRLALQCLGIKAPRNLRRLFR